MMEYNNILRESWAAYVGWEVGKSYYKSLGWREPTGPYSSSSRYERIAQDKQGWHSKGDDYTPLFIDLIDRHNQYGVYNDANYPQDYISIEDEIEEGDFYVLINRLGKDAKTLDDFKRMLTAYFGGHQGDDPTMSVQTKLIYYFRVYE